jgi:hypothetical protein
MVVMAMPYDTVSGRFRQLAYQLIAAWAICCLPVASGEEWLGEAILCLENYINPVT